MNPTARDLLRPDVWAPTATDVEIVVDGQVRPMHRADDGWWQAGERLEPGQRYAYRLDGGEALPDPRSLLQPDGVHGPSEAIDPAIFTNRAAWDGRRILGAVQYELHIGTFTPEGTFDAAIPKIPHLVELGVDVVEILPVAAFAGGRGWGYDGIGLYSVHAAYGGPEQMVRFIDACHDAGLAVVLDVVHNHLGPEGNYLAEFGPYFTDTHHTPWGSAVNLDAEHNRQVREFILGSVRQWIVDFQIDGLRLDAVHELKDDSDQHFLAELSGFAAELEAGLGRPVTLIAEADLNQPAVVSPVGTSSQAWGMHGQWADDVHHAIHSFVTREDGGYYLDFASVEMLQKALTKVFVHDGTYSSFREQDWGSPVDSASEYYDGHSFVVFMQNHDQVGNRPIGDRIGHTVAPGAQAAGAALYLLSAFTPMIFMGEEWNTSSPFPFFSHLGPELGPLVSAGRAREFSKMAWAGDVPDPQEESTWRSAVLAWDELKAPKHRRLFDWYQALIELRRREPEIADPDLRSVSVEIIDADTVAMRRGGIVVVASRAAGATVNLGEVSEVLLAWDTPTQTDGQLTLPGPGAVIARIL